MRGTLSSCLLNCITKPLLHFYEKRGLALKISLHKTAVMQSYIILWNLLALVQQVPRHNSWYCKNQCPHTMYMYCTLPHKKCQFMISSFFSAWLVSIWKPLPVVNPCLSGQFAHCLLDKCILYRMQVTVNKTWMYMRAVGSINHTRTKTHTIVLYSLNDLLYWTCLYPCQSISFEYM